MGSRNMWEIARGRVKVRETKADHGRFHYRFLHAVTETNTGATNVMANFEDALKALDGQEINVVIYHNRPVTHEAVKAAGDE